MSDDTATVELVEMVRYWGRLNFQPCNATVCFEKAADLIEQQARTIAELQRDLKVSRYAFEIRFAAHNAKWPSGCACRIEEIDGEEKLLSHCGFHKELLDERDTTIAELETDKANLWKWNEALERESAEQAARLAECERDAGIGEMVWKFIDRMNDVCEQDTAERILDDFTKAVNPLVDAAIDGAKT